MSGCPFEELVEDRVLGLPAPGLDAHLAECAACRAAEAAFAEERALFARRPQVAAPALAPMPPARDYTAPVVFAFAVACAAAVAGLGVFLPKADPPSAPTAMAEPAEEPLACLFPASGIAPEGPLECPDRATCEERVTSSLGTP